MVGNLEGKSLADGRDGLWGVRLGGKRLKQEIENEMGEGTIVEIMKGWCF